MTVSPARYRGFSGAAKYGLWLLLFTAMLGAVIGGVLYALTRKADIVWGLMPYLLAFGGASALAATIARWLAGAETDSLTSLKICRGDYSAFGALAGVALAGFVLMDSPPTGQALVGRPIELAGPTVDGGYFDLSQNRGSVVVVDFWASWCLPCLQELPNVVALHDKFKDSGVRVIGVSLDFHRQVLVDYLAQSPTPWSHIIFDGETQLGWDNPLARKLGVTGIPFLVVIGKDGLVYAADVRGPALERAVVGAIAGQNPLAPPAQVRLHRQLYDLFSLAPVWATAIVVFTGAMIGLAIELLLRGRAATPLAMDGPG